MTNSDRSELDRLLKLRRRAIDADFDATPQDQRLLRELDKKIAQEYARLANR